MPHTTRPPFKQRGLTLIELMVALIIGFMVILAAMSVFTSTSRSSNTVDAAGQLRDDARFAADIIQRLAVQTGFEDIGFVTRTYQGTPKTYKAVNGDVDPLQMQAPIGGFTGAMPGDATYNPSSKKFSIAQGAASEYGDTLILRYHPVNKGADDTDGTDGSMITCAGYAAGEAHSADIRTDRAVSVFYVAEDPSDGEPTLYCRYANIEGEGALSAAQPLVKGVERFKVLYGVDNVVANTATSAASATEHAKLIPDRYFTASQMTVGNDEAATQTNWRRVRAIRVGLVLRAGTGYGRTGQAQDTRTINPLGDGFGSSYAPNDFRLRQNYIFTINLRNCLNQGYQYAGDPGKSVAANIPSCDVIVPAEGV